MTRSIIPEIYKLQATVQQLTIPDNSSLYCQFDSEGGENGWGILFYHKSFFGLYKYLTGKLHESRAHLLKISRGKSSQAIAYL